MDSPLPDAPLTPASVTDMRRVEPERGVALIFFAKPPRSTGEDENAEKRHLAHFLRHYYKIGNGLC